MPSLNTGNAILSNPIKVETTAYNVGIGAAASSSFKLQVTGTTNLTGALTGTSAEFSGNNHSLASNNTLRFTDTDTATEANQQIGKIEFYSSDTSTPGAGVKAYIGAFAQDTTPDAYLSFATQDGSATPNPVERLRISSEGAATFSSSVNIGTAGSEKLNIFGAGSQFINVKNTTTNADMFVGMSSALSAAFIGTGGTDPIVFSTAGTEKMRITSGGNVGIGTSSPSNPPGFVRFLNISGTDAAITISNTSGTVKNWTLGALESGTLGIFDGTTNRFSIASTGAATFNLGSGEMRLNRTGTSEYLKANTYYLLTNGNDQYLGSETAGVNIYGGGVQRLNITGSGNMGFGVTPDAWSVGANYNGYQFKNASLYVRTGSPELYINNNAFYDGTNWKYIVTASAAKLEMVNNEFTFQNVASGTAGATATFVNRMIIFSGGQVAINRGDAGGGAFCVKGFSSASSANAMFVQNSSDAELFSVRNDGIIRTGTASGSPYNNTSAQVPNLYVSVGGTLERGTSSSMRYKENIVNWNASGLDTILALKPKTFKYKKDYYNKADIEFLGLIAEDVAEVSPYLADYENEDRTGQVENVRYATIVVPLIKAIQEQQAQIEAQQQQINSLINR